MDIKTCVSYLANAFTIFTASVSQSEIAQWVLFSLGILSSLISVSISLFKLFAKIKEATKDGQITKEELEDVQLTAQEVLKDIDNEIKKRENKGKEEK